MIMDRARTETASNTVVKPPLARLTVKLNSFTLNPGFIFASETDAVETRGDYFLSYKPRTDSPTLIARGAFALKCDMFHSAEEARVKGWDDVVERSQNHPVYKFLINWTQLVPELFEIAKANPGVLIPFTIRILEYNNYLKDIYNKQYGEYPPSDYPLLSSAIRDSIYITEKSEYEKARNKNRDDAKQQRRVAERERRKREGSR